MQTTSRPRKYFSDEQRVQMRAQAQDMAMAVHSDAEIAEAINVPIAHVRSLRVGSENPRKPGGGGLPHLRTRACEMFAEGRDALMVSILLNVHQTTAHRWLKDYKSTLQPA